MKTKRIDLSQWEIRHLINCLDNQISALTYNISAYELNPSENGAFLEIEKLYRDNLNGIKVKLQAKL